MVKVNVIGVPLDEEIVFIISLLIFLMLTAQYFAESDFSEMQYTSGVGAFLSALSIYVFYKLHLIEEKLGILHERTSKPIEIFSPAASKPRRRR
ncbi:MAG: hypothetical protein ABIG96_00080 [Candidatus Micrarchaeota archaeon]